MKILMALFFCFWFIQEQHLMGYDIFSDKCELDKDKPMCWANGIRNKIIKKFTDKYGLSLAATYDAMPEKVIHGIGVHFNIYHVISKQKARQIIVECVQDFITELNNHPHLRPYFKDYPCTVKNVDVALFIYHPDRSSTYHPDLGEAGTCGGLIIYRTDDPQNEFKYKTEEEETFEEAVEKAKLEIPKEDIV